MLFLYNKNEKEVNTMTLQELEKKLKRIGYRIEVEENKKQKGNFLLFLHKKENILYRCKIQTEIQQECFILHVEKKLRFEEEILYKRTMNYLYSYTEALAKNLGLKIVVISDGMKGKGYRSNHSIFNEYGILSLLQKPQPVHFNYESYIREYFVKEIEKDAIKKRMNILKNVFEFLESCKQMDPLLAFRMYIKYLFIEQMDYMEFGEIKTLELIYGNKMIIVNNEKMLKGAIYSSDEVFWEEWFSLFSKEMKKNRLQTVFRPKYTIYAHMLQSYMFRIEVKTTKFYHDFLAFLLKRGKGNYEVDILSKKIMEKVDSRENHLIFLGKKNTVSTYCLLNFGYFVAFVEKEQQDYILIKVFENQTIEEIKQWFQNVF